MFSFLTAHSQVESTTYNLMLKTLLSHDVKEVNVTEADSMIQQNYIFLDSRTKEEFEVSHIKNSIWVGYDDFSINRLKNIGKKQNIIVYCSVGYRSEKIVEKLQKEGYSNTSNLYGGIFEWVNQEKPIVDSNNRLTNNVHPYSKSWGIWLNKGNKVYK